MVRCSADGDIRACSTMVGRRILLVAPHSEERGRLVSRLSRGGLRAEACANFHQAESRFRSVAVLFVDVTSPGVDAVDLIRVASNRRPDLPIVALVARGDGSRTIAAIRAGARGYLFMDDASERLLLAVNEAAAGGRPMSRGMGDVLFNYVRDSSDPPSEGDGTVGLLTERERAVLRQLARGLVYEDVGRILGISVNTVRSFVRIIDEKLGANSRTEAVLAGMRLGLVEAAKAPKPPR